MLVTGGEYGAYGALGNEMRFIPADGDKPQWFCGGCAQWLPIDWLYCRNCGTGRPEPDPIEEAHQLFKQLAEGTLGRDEIEAADLAALEGES